MKHFIKNALRHFGFDVVRYRSADTINVTSLVDFTEEEKRIISLAKPFSMTSVERMASLLGAVTYVAKNAIPGDVAECGVWRGGSMMLTALTLLAHGDGMRSLYLYDTYDGMSSPSDHDLELDGTPAAELFKRNSNETGKWCYASLEDVRSNMFSTGYPATKIHLVKGRVEDTIPSVLPPGLAILRLDTDWYESTKHELKYLYPLLCVGGILIIDDYGHWQGARRAVDEYFRDIGHSVFLHRIDYTGRILVKTHA